MKKLIFFLIMVLPFLTFSQQLHYGSGGTVYSIDNKIIKPIDMRILLENNTKALELYNAGRTKKTVGNILFYGGLGLVATNLIVAGTTDNTTYSGSANNPTINSKKSSGTLAIVGGVLIAVSIPIKIGYPKKIKASLESYNKELGFNEVSKQKITLLASNQQMGIKLEF